ncbi:hypothetical protein F4782DRAFT_485604 [Xylaria castorea]|nr:hypothetical protein F4782DRAFT_485604 [Xylaria castorea]
MFSGLLLSLNPKAASLSHDQILTTIVGKTTVKALALGDFPLFNRIGLNHVARLVKIHIQALCLSVDKIHTHAADIVSSLRTFLSLLHRYKALRSLCAKLFLC